jgi:drug/metabolite transporter superfamily protein YnfA
MRRRLVTFLLAALAAIVMGVPLWAALRSERALIADRNGSVQVNRTAPAARPAAEAATLVFTGIILISLASAVRRSS